MPYDCFLSYASLDPAQAEALPGCLTLAGFMVWFNKARLNSGSDWHEEIEAGFEENRILLSLLTSRWNLSNWTHFETYGGKGLALFLHWQGDYGAVEPLCRRALEATERVPGTEHPSTPTVFENLAQLLVEHGSAQEARWLRKELVRQRTRASNEGVQS
jgi:hypothetical protein